MLTNFDSFNGIPQINCIKYLVYLTNRLNCI